VVLDPDMVVKTAADLWNSHQTERVRHDRIYEYLRGRRGIPDVPEGATDEIKEIASLSVKNVLPMVVEAFAQNLGVVGFRSPTSSDNEPVWALWQAQRMDARQSEIYRAALSYGAAYCSSLPDPAGQPVFRPRSPRQMFAAYQDPQLDLWPIYALETWIDGMRNERIGFLLDAELMYPISLGTVRRDDAGRFTIADGQANNLRVTGEPTPHGGIGEHGEPVCPVVRYINARDAEDVLTGEVHPLLKLQRAINAVNFDRLIVSRFGAFPQRYIIGWTSTADQVLRTAMSRVWTFDDETVQPGSLPGAAIEPYNALLEEMLQHVAMVAQIPLAAVTGNVANLAAEALAMAEAPHQRKLVLKRESFGESNEQLLRLGARQAALQAVSESAEVIWRDTEARSFAQVVDGITKLAAEGVPIEEMLDQIPGMTQQKIESITNKIRRANAQATVTALADAARQAAALRAVPQPGQPGQMTPQMTQNAVAG
jgi:hypothetical protein